MKIVWTDRYDLRQMAGEYVLVPKGEALSDSRYQPFILNDISAFILKLIRQTEMDEETVLEKVLSEYDVEKWEAENSIRDLMERLRKTEVIRIE